MEPLQLTTTLVRYPNATAFSALPDAPVVPDRPSRSVGGAPRARIAALLHRLADTVAPAGAPIGSTPGATRGATRGAWAGTR